jgi:hypothetical protein
MLSSTLPLSFRCECVWRFVYRAGQVCSSDHHRRAIRSMAMRAVLPEQLLSAATEACRSGVEFGRGSGGELAVVKATTSLHPNNQHRHPALTTQRAHPARYTGATLRYSPASERRHHEHDHKANAGQASGDEFFKTAVVRGS